MKKCSRCKLLLPFSDFNKGSDPNGLASYCKKCANEYYLERNKDRNRHSGGNPDKRCAGCDTFYPKGVFKRPRGNGLTSYCPDCDSRIAHGRNVTRFGISIDDYARMLKEQNGVCKICRLADNKRLCVDHDHSCCNGNYSCGKCIRGLICARCNKTLGMVSDSKELLTAMIAYL